MIIDIGKLVNVFVEISIVSFSQKKLVKEITLFLDFEKQKGLYFTLKRKDALKLVKDIKNKLNA